MNTFGCCFYTNKAPWIRLQSATQKIRIIIQAYTTSLLSLENICSCSVPWVRIRCCMFCMYDWSECISISSKGIDRMRVHASFLFLLLLLCLLFSHIIVYSIVLTFRTLMFYYLTTCNLDVLFFSYSHYRFVLEFLQAYIS